MYGNLGYWYSNEYTNEYTNEYNDTLCVSINSYSDYIYNFIDFEFE